MRVTSIVDDLLAANEQIRWIPAHQTCRFGNWSGAIDWSISRNRGCTPLPIWVNDARKRRDGSIDELEQLTGRG
jgi:isoleucyl-tRNA synthetase